METQVKALTILLSALGRFVCGNSAFSRQISTFYGPSVQTMETRLGARQRRRPVKAKRARARSCASDVTRKRPSLNRAAWEWSSLQGHAQGPLALGLDPGPVLRGPQWVEAVNAPMFETDLAPIRRSLQRAAPFGSEAWTLQTAIAWVWNPASNLLGVRGEFRGHHT